MTTNGQDLALDNKRYMSVIQRKTLVNFVRSNPNLLSGKFTKDFTRHHAQALWENITNRLNKMQGAVKEWNQWRKSFHDLKSGEKSKLKRIRAYRDYKRRVAQRNSYIKNEEFQNESGTEKEERYISNSIDQLNTNVNVSVETESLYSDQGDNQFTDVQYLEDCLDQRILRILQQRDEKYAHSEQIEYTSVQCNSPMRDNKSVVSPEDCSHNDNCIDGTKLNSPTKKDPKSRLSLDHPIIERLEQSREQYQWQKLQIAEKRLHLYEREVMAKERMAAAIESIASSMITE